MDNGCFCIKKRHIRRSFAEYSPIELLNVIERIVPKNKTVVDIGARLGRLLRSLKKRGYSDIFGIDGSKGVEKITEGLVKEFDLTVDCGELFGTAHWGLFFNVGEHVPKQLESALISNVSRIPTKGLITTWTDPFTPDRNPKNRKFDYYIANRFGLAGWFIDYEKTEKARKILEGVKRFDKQILVMHSRGF